MSKFLDKGITFVLIGLVVFIVGSKLLSDVQISIPDLSSSIFNFGTIPEIFWFWLLAGFMFIVACYGWYKGDGKGAIWVGRFAMVIFVCFVIMLIMFGPEAPKVYFDWQDDNVVDALTDEPSSSSRARSSGVPVQKLANWDRGNHETIPVGVWSKSVKLRPGCKVNFDGGNAVVYKVRTRLYNGDWSIHGGKGHTSTFTEFQFAALTEGLTEVPYTLRCP